MSTLDERSLGWLRYLYRKQPRQTIGKEMANHTRIGTIGLASRCFLASI